MPRCPSRRNKEFVSVTSPESSELLAAGFVPVITREPSAPILPTMSIWLAMPHVSSEFTPTLEGGHWSGLDAPCEALRPRKKLVSKAVLVERVVGGGEHAGVVDGAFEQRGECCGSGGRHR